jgi:hypothetical protein
LSRGQANESNIVELQAQDAMIISGENDGEIKVELI